MKKNNRNEPTVFVVDDDDAIRKGLSLLIQSLHIPVETFACGEDFLARYDPDQAGCLLLDIRMPGMSGLELQTQLLGKNVSLPIIMISGNADVPMAVRAMKKGAFDFIEKPLREQDLLDCIHQAIRRDAQIRKEKRLIHKAATRLALLTSREHEVMDRVVAGKANKVIAFELNISSKTVEFHRSNIMEKMQVQSLAELIHLAAVVPAPS